LLRIYRYLEDSLDDRSRSGVTFEPLRIEIENPENSVKDFFNSKFMKFGFKVNINP